MTPTTPEHAHLHTAHAVSPWARGEAIAVLALTLGAAAFRFYRLDAVPPGFHYDEAYEAVEALQVLGSGGAYHPIFFPGNFGVEPLFIYLTALAFRLAGASPTVMRAVSACMGTLTVPALYLLAREMRRADPTLPRPFPLAAAAVLAGLRWHAHFSRVGIEPVLVPLVAALAFALMWRGLRSASLWPWAGAGLFLGLGPYTYPAGRLLPVLAAAVAAWGLAWDGPRWRPRWRGMLVAAAAAAVVMAPLLLLFLRQPDLLTLRASQVAVAGREAGSPWTNILRTLRMFHLEGDWNPRSNIPGAPALDPWLAALFTLGLALAVWRWRRPAWASLPLWLGVMLLPTALSEYAPHFRRAIGAAPAVALLAGLAAAQVLAWGAQWMARWRARGPARAPWLPAVGAGLLVVGLWAGSVACAARDYFVRWAHDPSLFYAFDVGLWRLGQALRDLEGRGTVYLTPRSTAHYTLAFALWGTRPDVRSFDARHGLVLPARPEGPTWYAVILHEDWRFPLLVDRFLPRAQVARTFPDRAGKPYAQIWQVPPEGFGAVAPARPAEARLGGTIALAGCDLEPAPARPGQSLYVTLYWQALGPVSEDYTVFTHLLGPFNPETGGPVWAGHDGQPLAGSYPTSRWAGGEWVLDQHEIPLPSDLPPGTYQLEAGMYLLATGERLPVEVGGAQDNRVLLGEVQVAAP
ncbi:MAG: hypothetical protein H5T59_03665 [Anaerolineae bacterium]|nr:hypothetical protein [Anaerolineae bacterium]